MKQFGKYTIGGIQQKIFNLVLIMMVLVIAAYTVVILHQVNAISTLVEDANEKQRASITEASEATMNAVITQSLGSTTQMQAMIADNLFSETANLVRNLADYAQVVFSHPENYSPREVLLPDASTDGTATAQLITDGIADVNDPVVIEKLGLLGNLSDMMISVFNHARIDACYVAVPEGVLVLVDNHASSKYDENGKVATIPIRERVWYTGAVEAGGIYFSDFVPDSITGEGVVMCSMPVYADGKLAAVVSADLFLENMEAAVQSLNKETGYICIVNNLGHVIFSPSREGTFQPRSTDAQDLRQSENKELAAFVTDALKAQTDVRLIEVDGTAWYVTGSPIETVGWTILNLVNKEVTDTPTRMMEQQHEAILAAAKEDYAKGIANSKTTIFVLVGVVLVLALTGALVLAKRIVRPLRTMTERVLALGGENLQFRMEDAYRTGDEVEALAESFANLSARTLQYVDQVRSVTAEKERLGTELALAKNIQASMLPHIFPAFPERAEFDIFASMDPAKEVGGDFYDYFLVDDDHLCMVIADVSGKGVPAALFMMASKIILQSAAMMGLPPEEILMRANEAICSNNEMEMFVTVWLGILELSTGKLVASNAGHEIPAIQRPGQPFELYKDKHGFVIGGMEGIRYRAYELQLEPGSKLFVYTDGVAEATNAEQELFGTDRMIEALNADPDAVPQQVLKNVRGSVDRFVKEAEQFDDLTMLCMEYKGPHGAGAPKAEA